VGRAINDAMMMAGDDLRRKAWDDAVATAMANRNAEQWQEMAMAEEVGPPSLSLSFYFFIWSGFSIMEKLFFSTYIGIQYKQKNRTH